MESMLSDHKCCIFKVDPCILNMHHKEVFRCLQNGKDPNEKLGLNSSLLHLTLTHFGPVLTILQVSNKQSLLV